MTTTRIESGMRFPYWDRFAAKSPARQGEVLAELVRFDPALEAHPRSTGISRAACR